MDVLKDKPDIDDFPSLRLSTALSNIVMWCISILLWLPLAVATLPLFLLGLLIWGQPPIVSPLARFGRYFSAVFTEGRSDENIPLTNRILIFLIVLSSLVKTPLYGVCWFIDEMLYPGYRRVTVDKPVFFITAVRSGSTQLATYLENDEDNFIAPMMLEGFFPFIWFWKLVSPILKRVGLYKKLANTNAVFGVESRKRHNVSLTRTETWDVALGSWLFLYASWFLGANFMKWGMPFVMLNSATDDHFVKCFYQFTDHVLKKVMYHRGKPSQRILVKGHSLIIADTLEKLYPGAKFFATVREPLERFQSFVNFMMALTIDGPPSRLYLVSPVSWKVLRDYIVYTQISYCEQEMLFYDQHQCNKLAIPFTMFVNNLSATLQTVYNFCDIPMPPDLISSARAIQHSTHDRTKRKASYDSRLNRSLESLGIDEVKLQKKLAKYIHWVDQLEENAFKNQ